MPVGVTRIKTVLLSFHLEIKEKNERIAWNKHRVNSWFVVHCPVLIWISNRTVVTASTSTVVHLRSLWKSDWIEKRIKTKQLSVIMAVKWSWDEFDAEYSIILTSTTHSAQYSNRNLIQFFVKYGKITSFARLDASKRIIAIAKYVSKRWAHVSTCCHFSNFRYFFSLDVFLC